ncbi:hypothetical protein F441_09088 [Phytophthora nicotianae CJ01A1]|uniref:NPP1-like protein n=2 Tax=Phytophthora nicotianae TaxID=4792 RepID=W2NEE9_PHYNI|nr:hypothetical protein L915_08939 [Phytophthora nicotianae]ETL39845.1 hypothetical protein L916_08857 [Phytophthora nicotianae]ETM46268.1 hypothetical protein L914_08812 [Phytophthora nicotianae]ETP16283.1 hypothetical protein F441_09088 [Phytophthora nicotianae CJ01A1]
MTLLTTLVLCFLLHSSVQADSINHDQVQPFTQPDPVTISEKAAVKFKPQLHIGEGCVSFPAVNAAGEITGGLKGTKGTDGCTEAPLGSQMYGRATWYEDKWAMMFAWYFPKGFSGGLARIRHDWASMVIWLDNPALETPKILGASLSHQLLKPRRWFGFKMTDEKEPFIKYTSIPPMGFVGTQQVLVNRISRWHYNYTYVGGSNVSTRVSHTIVDKFDWYTLRFSYQDGEYLDLVMWEQLTDEARVALNTADFGESKVPFNDRNFETTLQLAWPFLISRQTELDV